MKGQSVNVRAWSWFLSMHVIKKGAGAGTLAMRARSHVFL